MDKIDLHGIVHPKKEVKMDKIIVPPIKIQGKKTQLIEWLNTCINLDDEQLYIEPFMGSGVVGINIAKKKALFEKEGGVACKAMTGDFPRFEFSPR